MKMNRSQQCEVVTIKTIALHSNCSYNKLKQEGLNKNVGGGKKNLIGTAEYQYTPRDRRVDDRRSSRRGVKSFEISRPLAQESARESKRLTSEEPAVSFADLLRRVPRYSGYEIPVVKKNKSLILPVMRLLTTVMVDDIIRDPDYEGDQKEVNLLAKTIVDSVNGLGSSVIELEAETVYPHVISTNGGYLGFLAVRGGTNQFTTLNMANERAVVRLEDELACPENYASICTGDPLDPWLRILKTKNKEVAQATTEEFHKQMGKDEVSIILAAAKPIYSAR